MIKQSCVDQFNDESISYTNYESKLLNHEATKIHYQRSNSSLSQKSIYQLIKIIKITSKLIVLVAK